LQIIKKDLEIEKEFPISIWQWAETRLETEPSPASHSYSPPPSSIPSRPSGLHGAQPSQLPLSRLQPSSQLPPFLFAQPIVQPSRRPERKSIPGRTPRGETRYRVHTRTVFINPSSSPFQIRCDPTHLLQIGDRTEIVSASATSRWISPYK
jgi:hypothetical protein